MVDTAPSTGTALLNAQNLECMRDDRVLFKNLSFYLHEKEVLQIEGANGSGKTSLLRILSGLRQADQGVVSWRGEEIGKARADYYSSMIYIGHLSCLKNDLTTLENIHSLLDTRSLGVKPDKIENVLRRVGLAGFEDVFGKALSSGQKRRVLLAYLLLAEAQLWILDEPLTALDVEGVALVESMIVKHKEAGGSIIFTTHHGMQLSCEMRSVHLGQ